MIKHCRKSLLFRNNEAYTKKNTYTCFDVTMVSYDGEETFELVGIHVLSFLVLILDKCHYTLYRGNGLLILLNANGQQIDQIRKKNIKLLKNIGFGINIF